jgi:hypothetical protein
VIDHNHHRPTPYDFPFAAWTSIEEQERGEQIDFGTAEARWQASSQGQAVAAAKEAYAREYAEKLARFE